MAVQGDSRCAAGTIAYASMQQSLQGGPEFLGETVDTGRVLDGLLP
jgi:hypothetical protein